MILSQIPTELVGDPDEITLDNSESFETMIQKLVVSSDEPVECDDCGSQMARITALTAPPRFNGTGFTPKFHR